MAAVPTGVRVFPKDGAASVNWTASPAGVGVSVWVDGVRVADGLLEAQRPYTLSGLTNYRLYAVTLKARETTNGTDSAATTAIEVLPHPLSGDEAFWTALVLQADNSSELKARFASGMHTDRATMGEKYPVLLATDNGGETDETTEEATAIHDVQFDVWALTDLEARQALKEIVDVYRNQPLPIAGAGTTLLAMRPTVLKEDDERYGTLWRGVVRLQFYVDEVSNAT